MAKTSGYNMYSEKKCPVCGKKFHPMPDHALRIGGEDSRQLVCTYSCMRKWEKKQGWLRRDEIRQTKRREKEGLTMLLNKELTYKIIQDIIKAIKEGVKNGHQKNR